MGAEPGVAGRSRPASPPFSLRPASRDDLDFLFGVLEASLGAYIEQTFGAWRQEEQRARFFERTDPATHRIVERAGEPIGCLAVRWLPGEVRLDRVLLLPAAQNQGIGSRLVAEVLAEAAAAGLPVRLRVLRANPAQRLYERLGFAVTGYTETHVLMEHARGRRRRRIAAALAGLAASTFAVAVPLIGAWARPGYSHVSQFISELGESGAPGAAWVSAAGFAPIGGLVLVFLALAGRVLPVSRWTLSGLLCLGAVGAGYLAASLAPCDPGCPATGSLSQAVHNSFGALEYVGAIAGLLLLGASFRVSRGWSSSHPRASPPPSSSLWASSRCSCRPCRRSAASPSASPRARSFSGSPA
jgi:ribosomal protein S18 acetylase RimI-like enzyme